MEERNPASSDWLTKTVAPEKLACEKALALISARIYLRRKELGLDQKGFAKIMGVSTAMVSKWESGNYNFTIETLFHICATLELSFEPVLAPKAVG